MVRVDTKPPPSLGPGPLWLPSKIIFCFSYLVLPQSVPNRTSVANVPKVKSRQWSFYCLSLRRNLKGPDCLDHFLKRSCVNKEKPKTFFEPFLFSICFDQIVFLISIYLESEILWKLNIIIKSSNLRNLLEQD